MADKKEQINIAAEEERQLMILLEQAQRLLVLAAEKELKPLGITLVQSGVLYVLQIMKEENVSPTPAEIARWLSRRPITVSALLTRMEKLGLITQKSTFSPKKAITVEMTSKGEQTYREMTRTRKAVPTILSSLSPSQRQQMKGFLEKLSQKAQLMMLELPY